MINKHIVIFAPLIGGGGVEKNLFLITNYLVKKFKKVSIITTSNKYEKSFNKKVNFITTNNFIVNSIINRRLKIIISLFILFRLFLKNKDFSVLSFQGNLYCCLLCKLLKIKIIVRSNASITGWSKGYFKKFLYKHISEMADKIIVNSKEFKKQYLKIFNIKTIHIYNPLNSQQVIKESKKKNNFRFFVKKTHNFINIGRLVEQKDQITLLRAFRLIKKTKMKFKLLIIGSGKNENILRSFIKNNNLSKEIKILNFQNNPYAYIKKSDAFILTSIFEGLPNVLLESLTLKKAIISSNCPTGPKEILDYGKGGLLFKMKNEYDLFKKINYYVKNKKKVVKLINYGHKRLDRFDFETNMKKYVNVIDG